MPTMPVSAAGWRMDPPVSVPSAAMQASAATAAAEPPEEPPGIRSRSQGFAAGLNEDYHRATSLKEDAEVLGKA